jgi:hypothetical protein
MYQSLCVVLSISSRELVQYYEGAVDLVVATTTDGRTIKFPANILRSVVQSNGVHGTFELVFNEHFKFVSISRIGD